MIRIKTVRTNDNAIFCNQTLSSFPSRTIQSYPQMQIFHLLSKDGILTTTRTSQQANGVHRTSGIYAFSPLTHTPPTQIYPDVGVEQQGRLERGSGEPVPHLYINFYTFLQRRKLQSVFLAGSSILQVKTSVHIFVLSTHLKIVVTGERCIIVSLWSHGAG